MSGDKYCNFEKVTFLDDDINNKSEFLTDIDGAYISYFNTEPPTYYTTEDYKLWDSKRIIYFKQLILKKHFYDANCTRNDIIMFYHTLFNHTILDIFDEAEEEYQKEIDKMNILTNIHGENNKIHYKIHNVSGDLFIDFIKIPTKATKSTKATKAKQ